MEILDERQYTKKSIDQFMIDDDGGQEDYQEYNDQEIECENGQTNDHIEETLSSSSKITENPRPLFQKFDFNFNETMGCEGEQRKKKRSKKEMMMSTASESVAHGQLNGKRKRNDLLRKQLGLGLRSHRQKELFYQYSEEILTTFYQYLSSNFLLTRIARLNQRFNQLINSYLQTSASVISLMIPRVERIQGPKDTNTLIKWYREVNVFFANCQQIIELHLICEDFKIYNPANESLINSSSFPHLQKLTLGFFDDERPIRFISPTSIFNSQGLRDLTLKFNRFSAEAAEILTRYFRDPNDTNQYRRGIRIQHFRLEYADRPREAVLTVMSGILRDNPFLQSFELILQNSYNFLNINNFIENFEDFNIGQPLTKLTLRDSFRFGEKTRFLDEGTKNLQQLTITKTILTQRFFKLDEKLRVLKLCPVNFQTSSFEIAYEQFIFVIDQLQYNQQLTVFEIGITHGNIKKKIFNSDLYERERKKMTMQLSAALAKVFALNRSLQSLTVQYRHANFEDCLKIAENLIQSVKTKLNRIKKFNGFPIYEYLNYQLPRLIMCEQINDFDSSTYDPLYCSLAVKLLVLHQDTIRELNFTPTEQSIFEFHQRREHEERESFLRAHYEPLYFEPDINTFTFSLMRRLTTVCDPFDHILLKSLKGQIKSEKQGPGQVQQHILTKFDLGFIPRKYHIIVLFFLRMNQYINTLHCKGINLKSDLIKNLMRDYINLKEFTLSFSNMEQKKREIGPLLQAILTAWKKLEFLSLENFQFNIHQFTENMLYNKLQQSKIKHLIMNDVYLYSTKLYANPLKLQVKGPGRPQGEMITIDQFPANAILETIIVRDLKMAYGMNYDFEFLQKFLSLRTFIIELNDLRGSDRLMFPRIMLDMTKALSTLSNLECVEIGQKPGHTSCVFEDNDIEPEQSTAFLKALEALLTKNKRLKRISIFYPLLLCDLQRFADIAIPKIIGVNSQGIQESSSLMNFYSLNCQSIKEDQLLSDFMMNSYIDRQTVISNKNYKQKKSIEVLMPLVVLKLFQTLKLPGKLQFFHREVSLEEEVEYCAVLNMQNYKDFLNSDFTILLGAALIKNPRVQTLNLVNLQLYDLDLQILTQNARLGNLSELRKLSFKRSCFQDRIRELSLLIPLLTQLKEFNVNSTNLISMLPAPIDFFNMIEKSKAIKILNIAAISEKPEDAKTFKFLLRAVKRNYMSGGKIKVLNVSENYMSPPCFQALKDIVVKNKNIKTLKFYMNLSDKYFNEGFLEMQRFFEEIIRKAQFSCLKHLILSKGNKLRFKKELQEHTPVLFIKENCQLTDFVFQMEKARKHSEHITSFVCRAKLAATKDFALFLNEFFKECTHLESIMFLSTNLDELLLNSKNINMFRDLRNTKLEYVNLSTCSLKTTLIERIVLALKQCRTVRKLNIYDNPEIELLPLQNAFRLKNIKASVFDDWNIYFPE